MKLANNSNFFDNDIEDYSIAQPSNAVGKFVNIR